MTQISLIVPFYGVEKYITTCLESLFSQDMPESEYEVICVNDCSPDHSEDIVLKFQEKHNNLRLIRHDTNKKLGAARNTGLAAAKGKYVWFIDSDDYIQANCLNKILEYCETNNLEILHWSIIDNKENYILKVEESTVQTGIEELLHGSKDMTFPWNRIYNREFLLSNNLWFNDIWGGDVIHTFNALNAASLVKNVPECFYFYRVDNYNSDMHSSVTANKIISFCYILARELQDNSDNLNPELLPLMEECVEWRVNQSLKSIIKLSFKEKHAFFKEMNKKNELRGFVLKNANRKVVFLLRFPFLSYMIYPIYRLKLLFR